MKKFVFAAIGIISLFLVSCQKEIDWGLPGGSSGGSGGTLLIKIVQKTGPDSVVTTYSYDGSKRIIEEKITGISGGVDADNDMKIYRNSNGIVTRSVQKANALVMAGIDSIETIYHFNVTTSRYTSSTFTISFMGFAVTDSTNFNYDGSGNIISDEHLQSILGLPFVPGFKETYTYSSAGNLSNLKQYSFDSGTASYDQVSALDFTFDAKINPLRLSQFKEAIVLARAPLINVNNSILAQYTDVADPANNFSQAVVYTYNSNNRPLTAVITETPSGAITNVTYYYQ